MEANGVREFPEGTRPWKFIRRAIGAAAIEVILPRLSDALMLEALAAGAVSRELCGRSMVYLKARTHYGVATRPGSGRCLPSGRGCSAQTTSRGSRTCSAG